MNICKMFIISIILSIGILACKKSVDIRNEYLRNGMTAEDIKKGKELLKKMERAYGGRENWNKYKYGEFKQSADWYGRLKLSNWDTLPQKFRMLCELGSSNSEMLLLNGKNKGTTFKIINDRFSKKRINEKEAAIEINRYFDKMVFKNYWFQFPFRIGEASIISYGGEEKLNGKVYNVLYATWESEEANEEYDQFLLYLDQLSNRLEMLSFTVRDKMKKISLTAEFKDFRTVNEFILPHSQFVRYGKPNGKGIKFHENHYSEIVFKY